MRLIFIIILLSSCKTNISRTISLDEVGWVFELPSNMTFKDSAFSSSGQINKSSWETSSGSLDKNLLTLFWIESDKNNFFNSILFIDSSDNSTWELRNREESNFYLSSLPNLTNYKVIDTSLSIEKLDKVLFQREYFKVYNTIYNQTFYSYKFSRKYGHYGVYINIRFTDTTIGNKYLDIIKNSKFKL